MTLLKSALLAIALAALTPAAALAAPGTPAGTAAIGETVTANVNGLVCDFCVESIRKQFGKEAAVSSVHVDLDKGQVHISLKPGETLDDGAIEKRIRNAGYALVSLARSPAP